MTRWLSLLLLMCVIPGVAADQARWKINLEQGQGLQSFDREVDSLWMNQQGILFLTSDQVVVYQVNRSRQARLGPRDSSGGGGNFILNIRVLSAEDGHLIKSLDLPTNSGFSSVVATRNGGFLARTGNSLVLYSADFEPIASRELPLNTEVPLESWQIKASPSGAELVLLHERIFKNAEVLSDNTVLHDGKAKVDVEILDSATLQSKKAFTLEHALLFWSPAEDVLFSSNPAHSYSDGRVGTLDFNGNWSPMHSEFDLDKSSCPYSLAAIGGQRVVFYGCESFAVFSAQGKRLFSRNDGRFVFRSAAASGSYLAMACDRYRMGSETPQGDWFLLTRADRIEVYDLERRARLTSVSIHGERAYYAISAQGDLAVVDGVNLQLLQARR